MVEGRFFGGPTSPKLLRYLPSLSYNTPRLASGQSLAGAGAPARELMAGSWRGERA
jgi:hypothetical protein